MLLTTGLLLAAVPMGVIGDDETPVRVIVTFKDKVDEDLVKDNGGAIDHKLAYIPAVVAELKPSEIKKLEKSDKVASVEEDAVASIVDDADEAGKPSKPPPTPPAEVTPWGVSQIGANSAWATSKGSGVKVAVVDTGIDKDHPDLAANIKGGVNFVASRGPVNSNAWDDDNGHGTHCAGIIAGVDNSEGVIGVAPEASLYAVKVLNKRGSGYYSDIVDGIYWSVDNGMNVISMSLSGTYDSSDLSTACSYARSNGVVVVVAAGNSGNKLDDKPEYPAAYSSVITVAATDSSNLRASWSNYGSEVDLAAPGVYIYSTYKGGGYATMSGTSMACPHVTGTVALVLEDHLSYSPTQVQTILQSTADDLGTSGWDIYYGYGLVDADGAVA